MSSVTASSHAAPHIVIVGGGITGLATAYFLSTRARADSTPLRYTLVERDGRLGGKIITERDDGFVVEGGPDSFVTHKPWALDLVRELGLEGELIGTNPARHATYVLHNRRLVPLPAGLHLIAPTRWQPFLRSPLFSWRGKLRMALEPFIPPRRDSADETLAAWVRRRFGREALAVLGEPLMAAIHSCEAEQQSMLATFPRFRMLEQNHGSVIRGMRAEARKRPANGPRPAPFVTLRGGIGMLVDALVDALAQQQDGEILIGRSVVTLEPAEQRGAYRVQLDDGTLHHADAVVLATPAHVAAALLEPLQAELSQLLRGIPHISTGTITLAYRRDEIGTPLDGYGVVIPRSEGRRINACTMSSLKFAHRAPDGYVLARVFVGGTNRPDLLALDDAALLALVREELNDLLGITATPVWSRIYRWWNANPQYNLGHIERVDRIEALCPPGLYLAGSAYRGVGLPDCIRQAQESANCAFMYVKPIKPVERHVTVDP